MNAKQARMLVPVHLIQITILGETVEKESERINCIQIVMRASSGWIELNMWIILAFYVE